MRCCNRERRVDFFRWSWNYVGWSYDQTRFGQSVLFPPWNRMCRSLARIFHLGDSGHLTRLKYADSQTCTDCMRGRHEVRRWVVFLCELYTQPMPKNNELVLFICFSSTFSTFSFPQDMCKYSEVYRLHSVTRHRLHAHLVERIRFRNFECLLGLLS
jgi:hypothetical protein